MKSVRIDDFEDPRIDDYRNLKDAALATRRSRFIVEGRGNLRVLLDRSAFEPDSILLSERSLRAMERELEALAPRCPILVAEQSVLDQIVGFPIHRGSLAVCARGPGADPLELARQLRAGEPAPRLIVLEGLTNHDNVGGIFRNAMALGGDAVLLCARSCDPLYRKAIRTSMGGSLCVPFARATVLKDLLLGLSDLGYALLALDPDPSGSDLAELDAGSLGPVALLLGTEGEGLTEETLALSDQRLRVEMTPGVDSLNVSVAAAIALHRLWVQPRERG